MRSWIVITVVLVLVLSECYGDPACGSRRRRRRTTKKNKNVDGGYTDWSSWSKCSQSCGNGIKSRERQCTNPVPKGNGKDCSVIGESTESMACNLKTCEGTCSRWYSTAINKCIKSNNDLRTQHVGTECLEWDAGMAAEAQAYAYKLLNDKKGMVHSSTEYGENLYWGAGSSAATCPDANKNWYAEEDNYNYATGTKNRGKIGHFTQMVWKKTQKFGVGIATGPYTFSSGFKGKQTYIVARYSPEGNLRDNKNFKQKYYIDNVMPCKAGKDCSSSATMAKEWK